MNTVQNSIAQVAESTQIANNNSVATNNQPQLAPVTKLASKSKRAPKPILWTVLSKAKRVFAMQIHKSNTLKLECVDQFVGTDAHDIERFWLIYLDQVELLLDSKRFERECIAKKLNPEVVAEHIVFEGSATVKRVIKGGLAELGSEIALYREAYTNGKLRASVDSVIGTEDEQSTVEQSVA